MNLVPENICGSLRYQGHRKAHPVGPLSAKLCFQTRCCPIARYRSTDQFVREIALVVSLGVEDLLKASLLEREDAELIRIYNNLDLADSARTSVGEGTRVSVRVDLGGRRIIKK